MAETTAIQWADATFNPWIGCTKVDAGCTNCYAEADQDKRRKRVRWGKGNERHLTSEAYWAQPLTWNRKAKASGEPFRVFCASLADVFDDEVPEQWRADLFHIIDDTPALTWMLLTKRPENVQRSVGAIDWAGNIWLGTSVSDQESADLRIPLLLETPAAVRFVSYEPALGPVDWLSPASLKPGGIDWIIAGGESGPKARPAHPDWFRGTRDQCVAAGVPFLFKQWGEAMPVPESGCDGTGGCLATSKFFWLSEKGERRESCHEVETDAFMCRVGKKTAGRELDGRTWDQFPAVATATVRT